MSTLNHIFSKRELLILEVLGRRRMTIEEISRKVFEQTKKPFDDKISIANSISRINKKCVHHKLKWSLHKRRKDNTPLTIKKEFK